MIRCFVLSALLAVLPGCIAWEIRDEMRMTNQHLCEVKPMLGHTLHDVEKATRTIEQTNAKLAEVTHALAQTQAQLTAVETSLRSADQHLVTVVGTLGQTNPKLADVDGGLDRLQILTDVQASLREVNASLKPLGKAMGTLGGAMSLIGLGDGSSDALAHEEAATVASQPLEGEGHGQTRKRPDPALGTWVQAHPIGAQGANRPLYVLSADGKFLWTAGGGNLKSGTWTRQGRTLIFTPEPATPDAAQAASAPPEVWDILTLNSSTLTLRKGSTIQVFSRPQ